MVRGLAGWLWRGGRACRPATGACTHSSIPPVRTPGWYRSPANNGRKERKKRSAMTLSNSLSHLWLAAAGIVSLLIVQACGNLRWRPEQGTEVIRPEELVDFNTL